MKVKLVTGYVPIPNHPRGPAEYGELGERLSGVPIPKKAFYGRLQDTWLAKFVNSLKFNPSVSEHDNPDKNSLAYHCVNHMKSTWLVQAANEDPDTDVFVWVDYGIFRLPGVCNKAIYEFFEKLDDRAIYAPGCWQQQVIESAYPCWRFCGSVIAVPRKLVDDFDYSCRVEARQHITKTRNVEWEVNTWSRVEAKHKLPIHWYKADHDVTLFNNLELRP